MANGVNIGIGIDLAQFKKDMQIVNKELLTASGVNHIISLEYKVKNSGLAQELDSAKKAVSNVQEQMKKLVEWNSKKENESNQRVASVRGLGGFREAIEDLKLYRKEYDAAMKQSANAKTDDEKKAAAKKIKEYGEQIALVNTYIAALGRLSEAMQKAGVAQKDAPTAVRTKDRKEIDQQIKLLQKKQELVRQDQSLPVSARLREEVKLQQQIVALRERRGRTYKGGTSKSNAKALSDARQELQNLRRQEIDAQVADIEARKARVRGNTNATELTNLEEEKKLQRQIVELLERKQKAYARGNSANAKALSDARQELQNIERKAFDAQIKSLEARKKVMQNDRSLSRTTRAAEELKLQKQIVAMWEKKLATYARGDRATEASLMNARRELEFLQSSNNMLMKRNQIWSNIKSLASRYVSLFQAWDLAKGIVETTGYFEQQQVALQGILGSLSQAQDTINRLKAMAIESPFEFKDLVGFTKQLSAYGIEQEKLLPVTKQLADLSAGLGVDMSRLILAYGQVRSASVLRGQELRQFTEAGVPMVQALADKFTQLNGRLVTTGEVFDLISKRQVSFEMVAGILEEMTSEGGRFYKMQENITDTLYGQTQKLKDMWTIAQNDMGGRLYKSLRGAVELMQALLKNSNAVVDTVITGGITVVATKLLAYSRSFKNIAQATKNSISALADPMRAATRHIDEHAASMTRAKKASVLLAGGWRTLLNVLKTNVAMVAITAIVTAIYNAAMETRRWREELEKIDTSFAKDTTKYIDGLDALLSKMASAKEGTKAYNDALDTLKSNYADYINPAMINQLVAERKQLIKTAEGWGVLRDSIVAAIEAKKDYERHQSKQEASGQKAAEKATSRDFFGRTGWEKRLPRYVKRLTRSTHGFTREYNSINASGIINSTIESFIASGGTDEEVLKKNISDKLRESGATSTLIGIIDTYFFSAIWEELINATGWEDYVKEKSLKESTPFFRIHERFQKAELAAAQDEDLSRPENYDPITENAKRQQKLAEAVKELVNDKTLAPDLNSGVKSIVEYEAALNGLNELLSASAADYADAGKTHEIAVALEELLRTITDPSAKSRISTIASLFSEKADIRTGQAAAVSTNIARDFLLSDKYSVDDKKFINLYNPTDATFKSNREALAKLVNELKQEIESYGPTQALPETKAYVDSLKRNLELTKLLLGEQYYDYDTTEKKSAYNHNKEYDVFFNEFKNAYQVYRKAIQQSGVSTGVAYMQTDKRMQELFGGFFNNGEFGEKFAQAKAGDTSVLDLIKGNFIAEGVEKGVVDFKKAAESVAAELKRQADIYTGSAKGQDLLQSYNALTNWIQSTFATDNLDSFLKDLTKSVTNLNKAFEKTTTSIDLYNQMVANGTTGTLGRLLPQETAGLATTPDFVRTRGQINSIVELYNTKLGEVAKSNPDSAIAKSKVGENLYAGYSIGNLDTVDDIYNALQQVEELLEVNNENFSSTEVGQILSKELKQLLSTYLNQVKSAVGRAQSGTYTGNKSQDVIATETNALAAARNTFTERSNAAKAMGIDVDTGAVQAWNEARQKSVDTLFNQFLEDNDFETQFQKMGGLKHIDFGEYADKLIEYANQLPEDVGTMLIDKINTLKQKVAEFNATKGGQFFNAFGRFVNADRDAKQEYDTYVDDTGVIANRAGATFDQAAGVYNLTNVKDPELYAQLAEINDNLRALGKDGVTQANINRANAKNDMKTSIEFDSEGIQNMGNAVSSVIDAFKSLSESISTVYDVLNDGENPEWMQQMDDFLGSFAEMFKMLLAPVIAITVAIAAFGVVAQSALAPLLIYIAPLIALIAVVAAIAAAAQAHDKALERDIENIKRNIEDLQNAVSNLNNEAKRQVGLTRLSTQLEAIGKSATEATYAVAEARKEMQKKNSDEDAIRDFLQEAQEAQDEFLNGLRDTRDEIVASTDDWASAMGDAIRSAFQNGENAARAFRSTVKEMIGDVVHQMFLMEYLQPQIEAAIEDYTGGNALRQKYTTKQKDKDGNEVDVFDNEGYMVELLERIADGDNTAQFEKSLNLIGEGGLDLINKLSDTLKDAWAYNSEISSLSGGIESITEDTARRLEALGNSQLGALLNIQSILQNYIGGNSMYGSSPMADIQSTMALIQSDTSGIRLATQSLLTEIKSLRNTNSQPLHVKVV